MIAKNQRTMNFARIQSDCIRHTLAPWLRHKPVVTSLQLDSLQHIDSTQEPLKMAIGHSWLELGLHMPSQITLGPHQTPLIVLHAHDPLWSVQSVRTVRREDTRVLQVWELDVDGRRWPLLEA